VSAGQVAALIAAAFFAVGMCAAVFVLLRLGRLISEATRMLTDYRDSANALVDRAQAAVDRTNEQLARTDSITASMDEVTANMAELSGHVSALAGLARGISAGLGAPLLRVSALAYGVRRAVGLRRPGRVAATAAREPGALSGGRQTRVRRALPRQRSDASPARREEARR
jgi:ABC-type transporter Mla subunit MlaD